MSTRQNPPTVPGSQPRWETAFERFETPEEEKRKFRNRLLRFGCDNWDRHSRIADIFCGRGRNLLVLEELGFKDLVGVDLSPRLLAQYEGSAHMICHDCRDLPFENGSIDIVIVQGGLHHLPVLPEDLEAVLASVRRVLAQGGRFVVVEPWKTPFLAAIHAIAFSPLRIMSRKLDAFATMVEEEWATYDRWLSEPRMLEAILRRVFFVEKWCIGKGKLEFVGRKVA